MRICTRWPRPTRRSRIIAGNYIKYVPGLPSRTLGELWLSVNNSYGRRDNRSCRDTHPLEHVRNIGIMAHIDAGKTTTTERILFYTGRTHRLGETARRRCDHGLDGAGAGARHYHQRPRRPPANGRALPVSTSSTRPATSILPSRYERSLRVLDGAVAVFCAKGGVEPQSETVWHQAATKYGVPRLAYVNKMDITGRRFLSASWI